MADSTECDGSPPHKQRRLQEDTLTGDTTEPPDMAPGTSPPAEGILTSEEYPVKVEAATGNNGSDGSEPSAILASEENPVKVEAATGNNGADGRGPGAILASEENPVKVEAATGDNGAAGSGPGAERTEVQREVDVGITEYISDHEGFTGVLKQRFSDFLVNEIGLDGNTVRLTDIGPPACETVEMQTRVEDLSKEHRELLQSLLDDDTKYEVLLEVGDEKEERTLVHQAIREHYTTLDSKTVSQDGLKFIEVCRKGAPTKRRSFHVVGRPDFTHFVLYKENMDTMSAVNVLLKFIKKQPQCLTYAGTKDKRAKTCQLFSANRVGAGRLHGFNQHLRGITLGNFRYCKDALKLGDLKGNLFSIVLRNVTGSDEQIEKAMTSLGSVGFINYYGMQRFGTTTVPTQDVGRALIKSQWQDAIELILKPREAASTSAGGTAEQRQKEVDEVVQARKVWRETHDPNQALQHLRHTPCLEVHLLMGLKSSAKNDLVSALNFIPRNTRLMYLHAYQSCVWNNMVSRRIKEFGLQVVCGDLVVPQQAGPLDDDDDAEEGVKPPAGPIQPVLVTEDTIAQHSIYDVVLPLPGHSVIYPANDVGNWYKEWLQRDDLTSETFKNKTMTYALRGSYRRLLVKPSDLHWSIKWYDDVTQALVLSDYERLTNKELAPSKPDGKFKALLLEFALPPSTYATMALREALKCDTSPQHQSSLNVK